MGWSWELWEKAGGSAMVEPACCLLEAEWGSMAVSLLGDLGEVTTFWILVFYLPFLPHRISERYKCGENSHTYALETVKLDVSVKYCFYACSLPLVVGPSRCVTQNLNWQITLQDRPKVPGTTEGRGWEGSGQ